MARLLDVLVFSSLWLGATAAALAAAAAGSLEAPFDPRAAALAAAGTLVVYNVDRLRDLERDHLTAPARSAFIAAHRKALVALAAAAALAAAGLAFACGPAVLALLAPIATTGFLHRRLKHFAWAKGAYIALAWTAVVVGLPWVLAPAPRNVALTTAVLLLAIYANAIASNVRDAEAGAARVGPARALGLARLLAAAGALAALLGPVAVRPLVAVPLLTLAALLRFRPDERYGLVVVDGALLAGGLLAALGPWAL